MNGLIRLVLTPVFVLAGFCAFSPSFAADNDEAFPVPAIPFSPERYSCCQTDTPLTIDGLIGEAAWEKADWTLDFVDIEGRAQPAPRFQTRVKMLWDETYFYVAAEMEEPHVWAKLTERDAVIYHDNDFEVFIDPNGDTHEYYELEINAFGTEWDLFLGKPYRDGGPAIHSWDIQGLKTAVSIDGTLNDPTDEDRGWSVEIAFPWSVLKECAHKDSPPKPGDQWRVNFSRVEWQTEVVEGRYEKLIDPETGKSLPEDNWVWSPQGLIAMHYPEMWGVVEFIDCATPIRLSIDGPQQPDELARWALRQLYYGQRRWFAEYGEYSSDASVLDFDRYVLEQYHWPPKIYVTPNFFEATLMGEDGRHLHISHDGRLW